MNINEEFKNETPYKDAFKRGIKPGELLTVSEWADKYRELSDVSSAEPGRWRTSRTPYLKDIMDSLSLHHPARKIVFMKAAQIGGTECGLNWLGYIIDHAPGPTMLVQPTEQMAKRNSKQRIDPLIEASSSLREKVKTKKSRDSGNTILQKDFPGGTLVLAGANSAVGLRSLPARYLFLDEVDGYPNDVDGEGDPITLASARSRTFSKRKLFLVSTPTVSGLSKIEPAFEASNKQFYHVPCPECGEFQKLEFKNLIYDKEIPHNAQYACCECGVLIPEHHKTDMLEKGKWIAERPQSKVIGFHLNSLYSPLGWYSWDEIIEDWIDAQKSKEKLRGFINTTLGETWKEKGDVPDWKRLYERREPYAFNTVPKGGIFLVAGVDVQKDRLEVEITAYGRELESWSVDYRVLTGRTEETAVWLELDRLLIESWPREEGGYLKIKKMGIDSGYLTQKVYTYVRSQDMTRVYATKGNEKLAQAFGIPRAVDVTFQGRRVRRGLKYVPIGVNVLKSELYSFLRLARPVKGESKAIGYCHFPEYGEEFFRMLTAEQLVIRKVRGFDIQEWVKMRERNESLDTRVICRAMAALVGIDRFKEKHWKKLEKEYFIHNNEDRDEDEVPEKFVHKPKKIKRRKGSGWL